MLTPEKTAIYRMLFHNKLARVSGTDFQIMFSEIMRYADPGFQPIKPQGSIGDWKNDGHNPPIGHYYQVYSPENLKESEAISKLDEDFNGLVAKWNGDKNVYPNGIQHFSFVINDYFRVVPGGYPTTVAKLEELRAKFGLTTCKVFLCKDLEDILFSLSEDKIINIVGFPPNPSEIDILSFSVLNEVVEHIVSNTPIRSLDQTLVSPDFDNKINFNGLTITAQWLIEGNYRSGSLQAYFASNSKVTLQEIRDKLHGIYEQSRIKIYPQINGAGTRSDQVLNDILEQITPKKPISDNRIKKELQDAALVLMAYFFESCDIFEEPVNVNA